MKKALYILIMLAAFTAQSQEVKKRQVVFYFENDNANPAQADFKTLLPELKMAKVTRIYGHTDTTATTGYNQKLSERRANNVAAVLKNNGINLASTDIKGLGETQPTGSGLITDRRVVLYYEVETVPEQAEAPKNMKEQIAEAKVGDKLRLKNMNFENNSDFMLPSSRPVANELLKIMKENPRLKIDIQGHICCEVTDVNKIAELRALAVYNYLLKNGIAKSRLSYSSYGSTRPLYPLPEKTEAEKTANRRVEIEILEN